LKTKEKETILIVDDTSSNIDILLEFLHEYDLIVATNGEEALEIINSDSSIDLVLLDIMMPKMDGIEVCKRIKEDPSKAVLPIIFITAKSDDMSIENAFAAGGIDYITKPFRPIELISRVKTHLKLVHQQTELLHKDKFLALGDLIGNISHQWKQPLSVISTAISGMLVQREMDKLSDQSFEKYCQAALDNCQYLSDTIEEFGVFLEDGKKQNINLKEFMEINYPLLQKETIEGITLKIEVDPSISCSISSVDFIHILKELISNATRVLKNKDERFILIDIRKNNNIVSTTVLDSGGGIDPLVIDKVFEPYFTTEHQSLGKGLNLFKIYSIVSYSFKGEINVFNKEFEYENKKLKGACFEMVFPCN